MKCSPAIQYNPQGFYIYIHTFAQAAFSLGYVKDLRYGFLEFCGVPECNSVTRCQHTEASDESNIWRNWRTLTKNENSPFLVNNKRKPESLLAGSYVLNFYRWLDKIKHDR